MLFQIVKILFNASNEELYYELMCNESFSGVLGILECAYRLLFRRQQLPRSPAQTPRLHGLRVPSP